MKFSVGTNWDEKLVCFAQQLNAIHRDKIFEFFAAPTFSPFGAARSYPRVPHSSFEEAAQKFSKIKQAGFKINYLINSSVFPLFKTKEQRDDAQRHLNWIASLKPDVVTIANEKTLALFFKLHPDIPLKISIVMAVKSIKKAERLYHSYPSIKKINLHSTLNRNFKQLAEHIKVAHRYGVEVELLANEICLYDCSRMKEHYDYLSRMSQTGKKCDARFEDWCSAIRSKNPIHLLNACWIRPEDVGFYQDLGVDIIKLAGRGESTEYLFRLMKAYMQRGYEGNINDLFYTNWWPKGNIPNIPNIKLNGFVKYLYRQGKNKVNYVPKEFSILY